MTYNGFIKKIMSKHYLLRDDARLATKLFLETLKEVLVSGEEVRIPKFGTFYPRYTKPRDWVQPSSGAKVEIPARVRLGFRAARCFDRQLTNTLGGLDVSENQVDEEAEENDE